MPELRCVPGDYYYFFDTRSFGTETKKAKPKQADDEIYLARLGSQSQRVSFFFSSESLAAGPNEPAATTNSRQEEGKCDVTALGGWEVGLSFGRRINGSVKGGKKKKKKLRE